MSLHLQNLAILLLHNSAWIAAAAALTYWLIRWSKLKSLLWQQVAWMLVLLPAACLVNVRYPVSISTPWPNRQTSDEARATTIAESARLFDNLASRSLFNDDAIAERGDDDDAGSSLPGKLAVIDSEVGSSTTLIHDQVSDSHTRSASQNDGHALFDRESHGPRPAPEVHGHNRLERAAAFGETQLSAIVPSLGSQDVLAIFLGSLVVVWLLGIFTLAAWYLLQIVAFQVTLKDCVPARSAFQKQWISLLKNCKVDKPIQLVEHPNLGPMLTITQRGWTVIVPSDFWEELNRHQRLGILRHELAHYQHGDLGWSLLARMLATIQWFNPLTWYALRRFEECAELRCDESILRDGSIRAIDYARALVQLIEYPRASAIAARSAGGASLAQRIGKLLAGQTVGDSRSTRMLCATVLGLMVVSAFVRPQFIAVAVGQQSDALPGEDARETASTEEVETQEPTDANNNAMPERESAVKALASKLAPRGDNDREIVQQFSQVVATPAGQVVMANRIQQWEEQLRQQAEAESTLAFVGEMFERSGEKFVLKKEHAEFPARFDKACRQFDEDAAAVAKMLQDYGSRLLNDNEANQLVKRYFLDPDAPAQVYVEQVQNRVRPDYRAVREQWEDIFVLDRNNRLVYRSGAKRLAEQQFQRLSRAAQLADRLTRALTQWSKDLSETDSVSKTVRVDMSEKLFAGMIATESMDEEYSIEQRIDGYFDYLENIFIDKADGLVPNEEAVAEIEEKMKVYAASKVLAIKVQPHLAMMARQLDDSVPNAQAWRELLMSNIGTLRTIANMGTPAADVQSALKNWLHEWLIEADDGKWTVNPDQLEDVVNATRERLRSVRVFRRRGLDIVEFGKQIDHPKLAAAYQTTAGKSLVMRSLQDRLSRQYFDGLAAWINEHLDASDDGYTLKDGHEWALQEILGEVDQVKQELANDDF